LRAAAESRERFSLDMTVIEQSSVNPAGLEVASTETHRPADSFQITASDRSSRPPVNLHRTNIGAFSRVPAIPSHVPDWSQDMDDKHASGLAGVAPTSLQDTDSQARHADFLPPRG